jgi:hypothetical protein
MTTGIALGRNGTAPPFGTDVISASFVEECETIDVTNRTNAGGAGNAPGYRAFDAGFKSRTWEIECHDATGLITALESNTATQTYVVMNVSENISIDGAVTFTVTAREGGL